MIEDLNKQTQTTDKAGDDIKKIAQWLNDKGIEIYCVELNFHKQDGHKIAVPRMVVGGTQLRVQQKKEEFSEEHHTKRGDSGTKEMYAFLKEEVDKLGKYEIKPVKNYVGFKRHQRFLGVRIRKDKRMSTCFTWLQIRWSRKTQFVTSIVFYCNII